MPVSFENRNFQKELDKKLELIKKEEKSPDTSFTQLLCTVQQLCNRISF